VSPLLIGFFVMAGYGLFLLIRALPRLHRAGEQKLVYCIIGYTLIAPLPVWLVGRTQQESLNVWLALPALLLVGIWVCLGYFVESYRKKREQERGQGLTKRPPAPPGFMRRNILALAAGLLIWFIGAFVGIEGRNVEIALLCISLFLLTASLGSFWHYRRF